MGGIYGRVETWLRATGAMGIAVASLWLLAAAARAEPQMPHIEFFTGFEASDNYASGYVGGGYAFGKGLYEKGWRLRAVDSFGRYHYDGTLLTDGVYVPTHFNGEAAFAAALVGYQFMPGAVIVKLFAGIEAEDKRIAPPDPNNSVQGSEIGLRLQAETWLGILRGCSSQPTPPMARPSRNIAAWRGSAIVFARVYRSGSRVARSAMRNTMPGAVAASRVWTSAISRSRSPEVSPAIISRTNRAATSR